MALLPDVAALPAGHRGADEPDGVLPDEPGWFCAGRPFVAALRHTLRLALRLRRRLPTPSRRRLHSLPQRHHGQPNLFSLFLRQISQIQVHKRKKHKIQEN